MGDGTNQLATEITSYIIKTEITMRKDDSELMLSAVRHTAERKGYNRALREERIYLKKIRVMIHTHTPEQVIAELTRRIRQIKEQQPKGLSISQLREMERPRKR